MYKEKIVVLHAKSYEVYDDSTRETNRGLTLRYIPKGKMIPCASTENGVYEGGYAIAKASLPVQFVSQMQQVPAIYDAEFDIIVKSDGKTEVKLKNLNYAGNIGIDDISESKK